MEEVYLEHPRYSSSHVSSCYNDTFSTRTSSNIAFKHQRNDIDAFLHCTLPLYPLFGATTESGSHIVFNEERFNTSHQDVPHQEGRPCFEAG